MSVISGAKGFLSIKSSTGAPVPAALCDGISFDEDYNLGEVRGLGNFFVQEFVAMSWRGSGSMSFYLTPLEENLALLNLDKRIAQTPQEWANYLHTRLKEDGAILSIIQNKKVGTNASGIAIVAPKVMYVIKYVFISRQSFSLNEAQMGKITCNFMYTEPYLILR